MTNNGKNPIGLMRMIAVLSQHLSEESMKKVLSTTTLDAAIAASNARELMNVVQGLNLKELEGIVIIDDGTNFKPDPVLEDLLSQGRTPTKTELEIRVAALSKGFSSSVSSGASDGAQAGAAVGAVIGGFAAGTVGSAVGAVGGAVGGAIGGAVGGAIHWALEDE